MATFQMPGWLATALRAGEQAEGATASKDPTGRTHGSVRVAELPAAAICHAKGCMHHLTTCCSMLFHRRDVCGDIWPGVQAWLQSIVGGALVHIMALTLRRALRFEPLCRPPVQLWNGNADHAAPGLLRSCEQSGAFRIRLQGWSQPMHAADA